MAGEVLAITYFREGKYVQAFSSYGGARRGTPVSTFIRVDTEPVRERCDIIEPDAIVCFDPSLLSPALMSGAGPDTVILINSTRAPEQFADMGDHRFATLDALAVAQKNGVGRFVNSAILGAFAKVMGSPDVEFLAEVVRDVSPARKNENAAAVLDGYQMVRIKGEEGSGLVAAVATSAGAEGASA